MIAAERARWRASRLGRADAVPATTPTERIAAAVVDLALPGLDDVERVRRLLRPAGFAGVAMAAVVLSVAGGVGLVAVGVGSVLAVIGARRTAPARRAADVERALPGVLESVARQMRAGGSLTMALSDGTPHRPPELTRSWQALVRRAKAVGVEPALAEWVTATHAGQRSVHLAAAALGLAASTGGSPARAIDGVAATLRARQALGDEIRALSSQARASAVVIAASPLVFGAAAASTDPRTGAFLRTPLGLLLVFTGVALDAVGWWWMSKLCRPPGR